MSVLLDTQAFLLVDLGLRPAHPPRPLRRSRDPETELLVSVASLWEIAIKAAGGA